MPERAQPASAAASLRRGARLALSTTPTPSSTSLQVAGARPLRRGGLCPRTRPTREVQASRRAHPPEGRARALLCAGRHARRVFAPANKPLSSHTLPASHTVGPRRTSERVSRRTPTHHMRSVHLLAALLLLVRRVGGFACTQVDATCSVLGDVFGSTAGTAWTSTSGWLDASQGNSSSYCGMYGVQCDGAGALTSLCVSRGADLPP